MGLHPGILYGDESEKSIKAQDACIICKIKDVNHENSAVSIRLGDIRGQRFSIEFVKDLKSDTAGLHIS